MSKISRETIIETIEKDLTEAKKAAEQAREFAVECAKNNSISGSGERSVAEGQNVLWQDAVSKLEKLRTRVVAGNENSGRVSLGALTELDMDDGEKFVAVIADVSCRISLDDATVVTPFSPLCQVPFFWTPIL